MATNITNRFMNENKRYAEAVVVTVPAILSQGGGRSQAQPVYVQGADVLSANVIEHDTIIKKVYLNIQEAFPAGATVTATINGVDYFAAVDGTATGLTTSVEVDNHVDVPTSVDVTIGGIVGDVTTGKAVVVVDAIHPGLKNGQYAN